MAINFRKRLRKDRRLEKRTRALLSVCSPSTDNTDSSACDKAVRSLELSPAREKVFSTPELLEAILLHLHPEDLLISQRTSNAFQEVIASSPSIQRRLFFKPGLPPDDDGYERTLNPFLPYVLRRNYRHCDIYMATGEAGAKIRAQESIGENRQLLWWSPVKLQPEQFLLVFPQAFSASRTYKTNPARGDTQESWRKMLVADQPCVIEIRHLDMQVLALMKTASPETLGDVADLLEELDIRKTEAYNRAMRTYENKLWSQYRPQMI